MGDTHFNISGGQQGAVGTGNTVQGTTFNQINSAEIDLGKIKEEVLLLKKALSESAESQEEQAVALREVEAAANQGDKPGVVKALTKGGKWLFGFAEKVGATLIAAIIKAHMGL